MIPISYDILSLLDGKTVSTAESCTGGGVGAALTSVSGISKIYKGGVVTYTDDVKANLLKVDKALLAEYGAVSAPVAKAMAENVRQLLGSDIGISTTGLAGPNGDDKGKPVGTVYIGYVDAKRCITKEFHFAGDREEVRDHTVQEALKLLRDCNS